MKRFLILLLFCLSSLAAQAQNLSQKTEGQLEEILARLDRGETVSLEYSCTVNDQLPLELEGSLVLSGNKYYAVGGGLEIYSDGSSRWIVDRESKEVYIESAGSFEEIFGYKDSLTELSLSNIRYLGTSAEPGVDFSFDTSVLDSDWVVTDLRED